MKRFTFEVIINEGNDEYWEQLQSIDQVCNDLKDMFACYGYITDGDTQNCNIKLKHYEDN